MVLLAVRVETFALILKRKLASYSLKGLRKQK